MLNNEQKGKVEEAIAIIGEAMGETKWGMIFIAEGLNEKGYPYHEAIMPNSKLNPFMFGAHLIKSGHKLLDQTPTF